MFSTIIEIVKDNVVKLLAVAGSSCMTKGGGVSRRALRFGTRSTTFNRRRRGAAAGSERGGQ